MLNFKNFLKQTHKDSALKKKILAVKQYAMELQNVTWKVLTGKMHNWKVENYVLFGEQN